MSHFVIIYQQVEEAARGKSQQKRTNVDKGELSEMFGTVAKDPKPRREDPEPITKEAVLKEDALDGDINDNDADTDDEDIDDVVDLEAGDEVIETVDSVEGAEGEKAEGDQEEGEEEEEDEGGVKQKVWRQMGRSLASVLVRGLACRVWPPTRAKRA